MNGKVERGLALAMIERALNRATSEMFTDASKVNRVTDAFKEGFEYSDCTIGEMADFLFELHDSLSDALAGAIRDNNEKKSKMKEYIGYFPELNPSLNTFTRSIDASSESARSNLRMIRTALYLCLGYMERGMEELLAGKLCQGMNILKLADDFGPSNRRIPGRIVQDIESSHIPTNTVVSEDFSDTKEFRRYFLVQPGNGSCPVRCVAYDTEIDLSLQRLMLSRCGLPENMHGDIGEVMKNYSGTLSRVVRTRKSGGVGYFAKTSRKLCHELNGLMLEKKFAMPYPNPTDTVVTQDVLYV